MIDIGNKSLEHKKQRGFTVVEICVVLLLSGFLFTGFLSVYQSYRLGKSEKVTLENIEITNSSLREFLSLNGRYPCPADPTLSPTDANYGIEQCRASTAAACPLNLVCTNIDSRDADTIPGNDWVTIGGVPFVTLQQMGGQSEFTPRHALDGYKMQFRYAVSESMTDLGLSVITPANSQLGAISIRDENNLPLLDPPASAHFLLISGGENMRGVYSAEGVYTGDCTTILFGPPGPPPPGNNIGTAGLDIELENCDDNDAVFLNSIRSHTNGTNYFDDTIAFSAMVPQKLWRPSNANPNHIYNTNAGNVGVGTNTPNVKFHVNGDIRTDDRTESESGYCDLDMDDCVDPEGIGGTNMENIATGDPVCPTGQVVTSIEDNNFNCIDLFPVAPPAITCPAGPPQQFLRSFTNLGSPVCDVP